jgi:hypothetical protein
MCLFSRRQLIPRVTGHLFQARAYALHSATGCIVPLAVYRKRLTLFIYGIGSRFLGGKSRDPSLITQYATTPTVVQMPTFTIV